MHHTKPEIASNFRVLFLDFTDIWPMKLKIPSVKTFHCYIQ